MHVLAAAEARERRAQDALLLNANGCVVETTCANLFWIQDGVVCTPPLTSGALPGVTRAWVINVGAELGVEVCERNVSRADLLRANGVFLTQSVWEIIEVTRVDETVLPWPRSWEPCARLIAKRVSALPVRNGERPRIVRPAIAAVWRRLD